MRKQFLLFTLAAAICTTGCARNQASTNDNRETSVAVKSAADPVTPSYTVKTIPETVRGKDILATIAANYKGKVALFDFWATWCPPCRRAMKEVDLIKPDLMKKGCAFVYITGETSPLDTWNEMIKTIDGDHYRLTATQWSELCKELNIPGIPAYLILDKKGEKSYDNLTTGGYPGNDIIQNNLEVALTR